MLRNDSSAIESGGGFCHVDLQLDVGGAPFCGALERLDRTLEIEGRGDQWLQVYLARTDEVERALIHIGVAEDGLDPQFLADRAGNVEGHRLDRNAHQHNRACGAGKAYRPFDRLRRAARIKHHVGAPPARLAFQRIKEITLRDVDRDNSWITAGDVELRLMDVAEEN